jgi:hypothetical protein
MQIYTWIRRPLLLYMAGNIIVWVNHAIWLAADVVEFSCVAHARTIWNLYIYVVFLTIAAPFIVAEKACNFIHVFSSNYIFLIMKTI